MILLPAGAATEGTISLGAPAGNVVPVNTTAATDTWSGYSIHIATTKSAGVTHHEHSRRKRTLAG